jgi:hypothetical protein
MDGILIFCFARAMPPLTIGRAWQPAPQTIVNIARRNPTMQRLPWLFVCCAVAALFAAGSGYPQDTKTDDKVTAKGTLPANWKKLGLSADQTKKILAIRGSYSSKIDDLKKQIDKLKAEDDAECLKVLTDDQKTALKKILTDKIDSKDKSDKSSDKKPEDKNNETAGPPVPDLLVVRRQDD